MSCEPRRRALCVTSSFPRWEGDSTTPFVLHLAQDLGALGWSVDVLAPHAPGAAAGGVIGGVPVERFRYARPESLETVCYRGGALANLRRNRLDALKLPSLVACEWAGLFRRLRRGGYDLLHSHWLLPQGFTGALAAAMARVPHVASVHGSDVLALQNPVTDRFKAFALRRADIVTVNGSATRHEVMRLAPDIANLHTVPMGASATRAPDADAVAALRARYRREDGPLLVFAGRVVVEKGVDDLVKAVGLLAEELPGVSALIAGEGQDRADIEARVRLSGLEDRIAFAGWIAPEALPDVIAAGDMFIGPSWFEAQGLVFAEAMLAGTPVIAADVGGVSDTVRHGETGLLVRARAPADIAAAVRRLAGDPALAERLAAAGRAAVLDHGLRTHTARAFADLFDVALARHDRRPAGAVPAAGEEMINA